MCCLIIVLALLGPRAGILVWWLLDMPRWNQTFSTFIWPLLGAIFLPWTTLAYVWVFPLGITGFDWFWLALGLVFDILFYAGGGFRRRWQR
ncbi:MAG: hypothetical protein PHU23_15700 [Dehalococcoidales bacterium]|nr:hypothetical protein [Dehalococcoidales bacterium]